VTTINDLLLPGQHAQDTLNIRTYEDLFNAYSDTYKKGYRVKFVDIPQGDPSRIDLVVLGVVKKR
jgi:hypothetical protein